MDVLNAENLFGNMPCENEKFIELIDNFISIKDKNVSPSQFLVKNLQMFTSNPLQGFIAESNKMYQDRYRLSVISLVIDYPSILKHLPEYKGHDSSPSLLTFSILKHSRDHFCQSLRTSYPIWNFNIVQGSRLQAQNRHIDHDLSEDLNVVPSSDYIFKKYNTGFNNLAKMDLTVEEGEYCRLHAVLAMFIECMQYSRVPLHVPYSNILSSIKAKLISQDKENPYFPQWSFEPGRILNIYQKAFDSKTGHALLESVKL